MALENPVVHIADLVATNPTAADPKSSGDDHIRNIKTAVKNALAGFPGTVAVMGVDGGVANAYTITPTTALPSYALKMVAVFSPAVANTGGCTLNVSGLGVKLLLSVAGAPLVAGDLTAGSIYSAYYDGTQFRLLSVTKNYVDQVAFGSSLPAQSLGFLRSDGTTAGFTTTHTGYAVNEVKGADIASAATVNLTAATGNLVHVTGTTAITAITIPIGASREVIFDGILTLTHSAGLQLPGGGNITTAAGDSMRVRGDTAGAIITSYTPASGRAVNSAARMYVAIAGQAWTIPASAFKVRLQAAGAGGYNGGGPGGGAGGYVEKVFSGATVGATAMIALGAKGTGAVSTANSTQSSGTSAAASSFTLAGFATLTAGGGNSNGTSGTATGGDINIPGQYGVSGGDWANGIVAGTGGDSMLGRANTALFATAPSVSGYGAGGSSGAQEYSSPGNWTNRAGANGGDPICIIEW